MRKLLYLLLGLLIINLVSAQELQVVKESNAEIKLGDIIEIKIHISNPSQIEKEFSIEEILPKDIEIIDPITFSTKRNDALEISYYSWVTLISTNSIMPRLATQNSPSKLKALGSESEPNSAIFR